MNLKYFHINHNFVKKFYLLTFVIFSAIAINAQYGTKAQITNIDFQLINEKIIITYDLINAKPNDLFDIEINIYNSDGYKINAQSIEGHFTDVMKGKNKQIVWYIGEDYNNFEDNIYVELIALHKNYKPINRVTRIEALAKSTLYPGWGSAQTSLKKINYGKGILGYGFLVSGIYLNSLSNSTSSYTVYDRDLQKGMSYALLGAAGIVWLWDYSKILFSPNVSKNIKLDIEANNYYNNFVPMLSLKFNL